MNTYEPVNIILVKTIDLPYLWRVKRFVLYILLIVEVLDVTALSEVFKIPILYQHFVEHKTLNQQLTFVDFMSMHYWGEDIKDDDDERDMQLPFKKIDLNLLHFLFIPTLKTFACSNKDVPIDTTYGQALSQVHFNPVLDSLFRPPQI